jgi:hypothetical protein
LTASAARTGSATGREQNCNVTTNAMTTQLLGEPELDPPRRGPVMEPACRVDFLAPPAKQCVVDRDRKIPVASADLVRLGS